MRFFRQMNVMACPVKIKMRLQALALCSVLGLPSVIVTLCLFVIKPVDKSQETTKGDEGQEVSQTQLFNLCMMNIKFSKQFFAMSQDNSNITQQPLCD